MKVSEIMTAATVTDRGDDTIAQAAHRMWEQQTGSLLIVDGAKLVGIVTERDVMKAVATGVDLASTKVSQLMRTDPITVHPGATLREAAKIMADEWIRHIPVVEGDALVGIISQRDLTGVLAGALNEPEALAQLVEASELARERRLKRIEAGTWD
ncbi:MAG: CBS domain-containing protein [Actinomycetota bacterium]